MLGHSLRYRPLTVHTPDGLRIAAQDWRSAQAENGPGPKAGPPVERGSQRDVLLIHGISQMHLCWLKQLTGPLRQRHRLVTFDLRGHGGSDKPLSREYYQESARWGADVRAVIETAGLQRPILVAWSYGGRVALDYLLTEGVEGISGLVMVAATSRADRSMFGSAASLLPRMAAVTGEYENIEATRQFLSACVAHPLPAAEQELMLAYNLLTPPAVRSAMEGRPTPYEEVLRALRVPVLALHGAEDTINLPEMSRYTARTCPNGRALVYAGVGHTPFWEAPARFDTDLLAYLEALAAA